MATFYLVQNDRNITMTATLRNADRTPIDLTDAEVLFHMGYEGDPASIVVEGLCTIVDAEAGQVRYTWKAEDTNVDPAQYCAEFQITWGTATIRTVPTRSGGFRVVVRGEVG